MPSLPRDENVRSAVDRDAYLVARSFGICRGPLNASAPDPALRGYIMLGQS